MQTRPGSPIHRSGATTQSRSEAPAIVQPGVTAWRWTTVDRGGVVMDAADYYHAFYRAAQQARHEILMSGWQFDSDVPLLRGDDVHRGAEVRFLKLLDRLCTQNPRLRVYILAWDFHLVFALEREWLQRIIFHWSTNSRLRFQFDRCEAAGGAHHQKFVVIDGRLAFLGGMDVCESRWDDRRHLASNPLRLSHGRPVKPYHDAQAFLLGGTAPLALRELFAQRWERTGAEPLEAAPRPDPAVTVGLPRGAIELPSSRVALSRTQPGREESIREIERLFVAAIDAAEALIYVETQYFSSRRILEALRERMEAPGRGRLEIVCVVNERAEALKEELAVGRRQAEILEMLRRIAAATGHALGLYYPVPEGDHATFGATYVHSKILSVDDRFLTVGSANCTNRSMGMDSELHAAWEIRPGEPGEAALRNAIRAVRVSLLAEHSGWPDDALAAFGPIEGLVAHLDARSASSRLRRLGSPSPTQQAILEAVDPQSLPFDPEAPDNDTLARDEPAEEARRGRWGAFFGRLLKSPRPRRR